jgi:N-carbamoyl-L-amino-acid hydrolase
MRHTGTVMGLLAQIADVGRDPARGSYTRPGWSGAEATLRDWFTGEAARRSLDVTTDRNGIAWAWWNPNGLPLRDAVLTGSHLDSVPGGGAFDGPLGVASALVALDLLRNRDVDPAHPLAIAVFPEEEGSRFGVACLGSRLLTGALDPARATALTDPDGVTLAQAAAARGLDPAHLRRDDEALASARSSSCTWSRVGDSPTSGNPSRSPPRCSGTAAGGSPSQARATTPAPP